MTKIVLVENVHQVAIDLLKKRGFNDITLIKDSPKEDDLIKIMETADVIGIRTRTKLTKEVLKHAKNIMAVCTACIGTDQIDLNFARDMGIPCFNAPFGNTRSVAELTIGEMLMLAREIPDKDAKAKKGIWDKSLGECFEVKGKTLGIIGYGHIGSQVGVLAEALSMNVIYYDVEKKQSFGKATPVTTLEELLKNSDIVTIHVPNLPSTYDMIGKKEFALMKKNGIFINNARGNVVDFDALCEALDNKMLMGVACDAYKKEPKNKDEELETPLRKYNNVIITPHIGGMTAEAQVAMALDMAEKMANYLQYGSTEGAVNFPQVSLGQKGIDTVRILHIHENIAGVMKDINHIFGKYNVNVDKQYLDTYKDIGFVASDIRKDEFKDEIINELKKVKTTKRVAVI
ncbi:MAG: phosphoglycerate dehydrogenase [Rickettsiales bacterium]|jgi:D-3-phosphoglycerate dehydrogenase|nr:phosphoglycerate dehydrogenase [Rickettsiales bacterium]